MSNEKRNELQTLMADASEGELEIILGHARKLMGEGIREYGHFDAKTEKRSVIDFLREASDELSDVANYLQMAQQVEALSLPTEARVLREMVLDRDRIIAELRGKPLEATPGSAEPECYKCPHGVSCGVWCSGCQQFTREPPKP